MKAEELRFTLDAAVVRAEEGGFIGADEKRGMAPAVAMLSKALDEVRRAPLLWGIYERGPAGPYVYLFVRSEDARWVIGTISRLTGQALVALGTQFPLRGTQVVIRHIEDPDHDKATRVCTGRLLADLKAGTRDLLLTNLAGRNIVLVSLAPRQEIATYLRAKGVEILDNLTGPLTGTYKGASLKINIGHLR